VMPTPVEMLLAGVSWEAVPDPAECHNDGIPYATHRGVLELAGQSLRCYRLSNGLAVFDADDLRCFLGGWLAEV
jgi:hypothetical protein